MTAHIEPSSISIDYDKQKSLACFKCQMIFDIGNPQSEKTPPCVCVGCGLRFWIERRGVLWAGVTRPDYEAFVKVYGL